MKKSTDNRTIDSLNQTGVGQLSIDELESRLAVEELDQNSEMWTGCGCANVCTAQWTPDPGCVPYFCAAKGTW